MEGYLWTHVSDMFSNSLACGLASWYYGVNDEVLVLNLVIRVEKYLDLNRHNQMDLDLYFYNYDHIFSHESQLLKPKGPLIQVISRSSKPNFQQRNVEAMCLNR